jgi:hypothetical protein
VFRAFVEIVELLYLDGAGRIVVARLEKLCLEGIEMAIRAALAGAGYVWRGSAIIRIAAHLIPLTLLMR